MQEDKNLSEIDIQDQHIMENKELNLLEALIPVVILMGFLAYNIFAAEGEMFGTYSNQYETNRRADKMGDKGRVNSPCNRNCSLDEQDICIGCGRSLAEILNWQNATDQQRAEVLGLAKNRLGEREIKWR